MKVKITKIRQLLEKKLVDQGLPKKEAIILADEYLQGELQGKHGHGLAAFPSIVKKIPTIESSPKIIKKTKSLLFIDANNNPGAIIGKQTAEELTKMAQEQGVAMALIKNMMTWLRPGTIARLIADQGSVGFVVNTGGKPMVAPPGGYEPVIGTNPIGIGIPTENQPILTDMATAKKAWGKVKTCQQNKEPLPKKTYYNNSGEFTIDPNQAYSVIASGDYKGFSLSLFIEIICGSLIGMSMGKQKLLEDYRTLPRGAMVLVVNPQLMGNQNFKKDNSRLVNSIKKSKKLKGTKEILVPGERSLKIRQQNLKKGSLEINNKLWQEIENL